MPWYAWGMEPIEKPVLMSPNPNKIVSDADWKVIEALYCAGELAATLGERYGIQPATIHSKASKDRWPTPNRIIRAAQKEELITDDPASALADLWTRRKAESRESLYKGSKKALERFFAHSPVPQSFAEAAIAEKLLAKAIDPDADKEKTSSNVNIGFLCNGFEPKPIDV